LCRDEKFGTIIDAARKSDENADFLTRKRGFFASEVAGGRKYCKNEGVCNSLIINNKSF
jgi:hypothetical protein